LFCKYETNAGILGFDDLGTKKLRSDEVTMLELINYDSVK